MEEIKQELKQLADKEFQKNELVTKTKDEIFALSKDIALLEKTQTAMQVKIQESDTKMKSLNSQRESYMGDLSKMQDERDTAVSKMCDPGISRFLTKEDYKENSSKIGKELDSANNMLNSIRLERRTLKEKEIKLNNKISEIIDLKQQKLASVIELNSELNRIRHLMVDKREILEKPPAPRKEKRITIRKPEPAIKSGLLELASRTKKLRTNIQAPIEPRQIEPKIEPTIIGATSKKDIEKEIDKIDKTLDKKQAPKTKAKKHYDMMQELRSTYK